MSGSPTWFDQRTELDAVVLDVGRVIVGYDFDHAYRFWSRVLERDPGEIRDAVRHDEAALSYERGQLRTSEYAAHLGARLGPRMTLDVFEEGWNAIFDTLIPGIDALIPMIADRVRLLALSNTNDAHATFWRTRYAPAFQRFERIFCSHELGARKPDPAIYRALIDYTGLPPHRIAFFDDIPSFVDGGRQAGLRAYLADGTPSIATKLAELGVLGPAPR